MCAPAHQCGCGCEPCSLGREESGELLLGNGAEVCVETACCG